MGKLSREDYLDYIGINLSNENTVQDVFDTLTGNTVHDVIKFALKIATPSYQNNMFVQQTLYPGLVDEIRHREFIVSSWGDIYSWLNRLENAYNKMNGYYEKMYSIVKHIEKTSGGIQRGIIELNEQIGLSPKLVYETDFRRCHNYVKESIKLILNAKKYAQAKLDNRMMKGEFELKDIPQDALNKKKEIINKYEKIYKTAYDLLNHAVVVNHTRDRRSLSFKNSKYY